MPHGTCGFTPINHCDRSSPSELVSVSNQQTRKARQGGEARRRRKNPLIQKYLSPGKSAGASMFERAAISQGEEPQLKKRKTAKDSEEKRQHATEEKARPRPNTSGRRVVSEGTQPFAFLPLKPQDPAFNPRSAADKFVINDQRHNFMGNTTSSSNTFLSQSDRSSAMDDSISIVSPLTSMDIISSQPSQQTSCDSFRDRSTTYERRTSSTSLSDDIEDPTVHYLNRGSSHPSGFLTQSKRIPSHQRRHKLSRSPRLGTIFEEFDADALPVTQNNRDKTRTLSSIDTTQHEPDDFDIFDGLSDTDLFLSLPVQEAERPQEDTPDLSTSKIALSERSKQSTLQSIDQTGIEEFFAEDWGLFDEENDILEEPDPSIDSATILNQVSSNTQKVQATPTTLAPSGTKAEAKNVHSPDLKPILRPHFPDRVQERSPVLGLSGTNSLRVCFRIGEALNVGIQAVREHQSVIIELYARVRWSFREPRSIKQHFILMDLFHDRPPYLDCTYEGWKGVGLFEDDCARFLERPDHPLICRCMGKLKRDNTSWRLTIANIWEASMDDVEHALAIVQS